MSAKAKPRKTHRVTRDNPAETCMNCLARVTRSRMREHACSPECLVAEWRRYMREIGYVAAGHRINLSQVAQGFVPGSASGYVLAPVRVAWNRFGENASVVQGKWVPKKALDAADECLKADIAFAKERRLARILYAREGALDAWRAAKKLGGKDALRGLALALLAEDEVSGGLGAP